MLPEAKHNSWFSHDVTKIWTKKLSLLLSFYFHVILEHLKTLIQTNFRFRKGSLFCDTGRLNFQAWRDIWLAAGKALKWVKNITEFWRFCYLDIPCLRINIASIFMSSSSEEFTHKWENSKTDVSVSFRRPYLCPWKGPKHGVYIQSFINLGKTLFRISRIWTIA